MSPYRLPSTAPSRRPYAAPSVRRKWWWHLLDLLHRVRPWARGSTWYRRVGATEESYAEVRAGLRSIIDGFIIDGFNRRWFYGAAMATYEVEKAIDQARPR